MDGNEAASYISYAFTETAAIYPITPSSPMATHVDEWAANGLKNIFGTQVRIVEMQAEAGACGTLQGMLEAGSLCNPGSGHRPGTDRRVYFGRRALAAKRAEGIPDGLSES